MKKRSFLIILIASILVLTFGVLTCSAETSGSCGDSLTWSITGTVTEKTLTISGTGLMYDYGDTASPWADEKGNIKSVVIENGVTSIGSCAFDNFTGMTSVTIPESVTDIGNDAFNKCTSLTEVSIPGEISKVRDGTFRSCQSLTTVELPTSITVIGAEAFDSCSSMTSFVIPSGVVSIGMNAFTGCNSMTSITIPSSVRSIGDSAFTTGVLKYVFFGGTAANWNSLSPDVGDAAVHIGTTDHDYDYGFTVDVRPTATTPGSISRHCSANGCDAKKDVVEIPATGYFQMGTMAADMTWTLTGSQNNLLLTIYGTGRANESVEINNNAGFISQKKNIKSCRIVGDTIDRINGEAFSGFSGLSSITLSDGLTTIDEKAFENCTSLTSFTVPENITSMNWGVFSGCTNLSSVTILGKFTVLPERTFQGCSKLESVSLPNSITEIDYNAFNGCSSLESIVLPNSVKTIDENAFYGCSSLESITLSNTLEDIYNKAFMNCSSLASITIPATLTNVGEDIFKGCTSLSSVEFESGTKTIPQSFFKNNTALESVTIPNTVTTIDDGAFYGCSSLKSISLPSGLTVLGTNAFANCISLASISLPGGVKEIRYGTFLGCTKLAEVIINSGTEDIYDDSFNNCTSLTNIAIPASVTFVHEKAFIGSGLKYLFYAGSSDNNWGQNLAYWEPEIIIHYNCTGHVYGDFIIEKDATCTEAGSKYKSCTQDGCDAKTDVTEIAALGHNMTPHAAVAATCTTPGNSAYWSCDRCSKYFSDADGKTEIAADSWVINAKGHNMTEHPAVAATCTAPGNSAYCSCDKCGKFFSDKDATSEVAENSWVIAALDHSWNTTETVDRDATCEQNGSKSIHCSRCGVIKEGTTVVIPMKGHNWTSYVSKPATEFEVGFLTHRCTNCGSAYNTAIPQIALPTDLPTVKISKPAAAKKKITVKWKKVNKNNQKLIDGIEMRVTGPGYDSIFTAGKKKTSKKIGGLQRKQKYAVQVRSYKYIGGVKHVSAWSGVKTAKVK